MNIEDFWNDIWENGIEKLVPCDKCPYGQECRDTEESYCGNFLRMKYQEYMTGNK